MGRGVEREAALREQSRAAPPHPSGVRRSAPPLRPPKSATLGCRIPGDPALGAGASERLHQAPPELRAISSYRWAAC